MPEENTGSIHGFLRSKKPTVSKNGKPYTKVGIEGPKGLSVNLFDWNNLSKDFEVGQIVIALFDNGQYPRLLNISPTKEMPEGITQETVSQAIAAEKSTPAKEQKSGFGGFVSSQEYLAARLAVDLVQGEQIQVDKKMERWGEAYDFILRKWRGEDLPAKPATAITKGGG